MLSRPVTSGAHDQAYEGGKCHPAQLAASITFLLSETPGVVVNDGVHVGDSDQRAAMSAARFVRGSCSVSVSLLQYS